MNESHIKCAEPGRNNLSGILPGYTATMSLDSSDLDKYRNQDGAAIKLSCVQTGHSRPSNFKKGEKRSLSKVDAGSGWFNMEPTPITSKIAADIAVIRNRQYLNPNRFYKSSDMSKSKNPVVQLGTVIEGPTEYFSSRLAKKDRRSNITDEFMRESFGKGNYVQEKYNRMQRENTDRAKKRKRYGKHKPKQK